MKFDLDSIVVEDDCRDSALTRRVLAATAGVPVSYVGDGRVAARPLNGLSDPFGMGKRRLVIMRRRSRFLMGCPAASAGFACCGYLVLILASNCPMDCSYCFLQEYVRDNPGLQVYANYTDALDELERLRRNTPSRQFRIGTGELADSLAFDRMTGIARELVQYFAARDNLLLELKTKTDEIDGLLGLDPGGHSLISWTLSPMRVYLSSEHRTASPSARIAAARRVADAGYRIAFHLDPIIAYDCAESDYALLIDELFDTIAPARISYISMGGLRMMPGLRAIARQRFPRDPLLCGEEVLAPDGRYRTFVALRLKLYQELKRKIHQAAPGLQLYLCMESASINERVLGMRPLPPSQLGARLAQ